MWYQSCSKREKSHFLFLMKAIQNIHLPGKLIHFMAYLDQGWATTGGEECQFHLLPQGYHMRCYYSLPVFWGNLFGCDLCGSHWWLLHLHNARFQPPQSSAVLAGSPSLQPDTPQVELLRSFLSSTRVRCSEYFLFTMLSSSLSLFSFQTFPFLGLFTVLKLI